MNLARKLSNFFAAPRNKILIYNDVSETKNPGPVGTTIQKFPAADAGTGRKPQGAQDQR
jgi:hypothetical protein